MLYSNENNFTFYTFKVQLVDNGEKREFYTNDKQSVEEMLRNFPRIHSPVFTDVIPTEEQKARLEVVNNFEAENKAVWHSEVCLFVETGAIPSGTNSEFLLGILAEHPEYQESTLSYEENSKQERLKKFDLDLMQYYDTVAQTKGYDNRITCALRAGFDGPFKAEGLAFAQWMDTCNSIGYAVMQEVFDGTREEPSSIEEVIAEFPSIVW